MFKAVAKMIAVTTLAVGLIACGDTTQPVEGTHFKRLENSLQDYDLAPVTEVFSLTCGHCRTMEANIPMLEDTLDQKIGKVHVMFNQSAQLSAILYYTAELQLKTTPEHEMMNELFAVVQAPEMSPEQRQAAIVEIYEKRNLISPYHLDEPQREALFKILERAEIISRVGQINSVPAFIVKGEFQILSGGHNSIEEIAETISFLLKQP